jgi:2-polyprenyl-3-methyl-5-hydroxy-6-metoxy-1,4-benzoquinol methylase
MKDWFVSWFDSPYYHLLYNNRNEHEAQAFVEKIVAHFSLLPHSTLLDLACGKGRHSLAFAKLGLDVTGIDLSKNSIAFAKQYEHSMLHFYEHDMRNTFRTNYYDLVCNLFTSFGYFKTAHDNVLAARTMLHAVKPNGYIVIDFVNRQHARQNIETKRNEKIERNGIQFTIKRNYTEHQFLKEIIVHDNNMEHTFYEQLNSFTLNEMKQIFEQAGSKFASAFGNYQLEDYQEDTSPRMILVFEK